MPRIFFSLRCRPVLPVLVALLVAVASSAPIAAQAPTLGDVARKEQERRKALPAATKVYTNNDLPKSAIRPEGAPPAAPAAEPSSAIPSEGAAKPAQSEEKQPEAGGEAAWKKRMGDAREELRRNEMFAEALQTRINSLSQDVRSRDDPAQRGRIAGDRKDAIAELARVKQAIESGKKSIADIEEEARKAGVPPGWLR
ncbi:MAG: hypothetical protein ACRD1U_08635 [Vicinamibacterales bacterium]